MEITRHFTATTFIVFGDKALLHWHKSLQLWLPIGGHIDRDELPAEAALREIVEEAGIEVALYQPSPLLKFEDDALELPRPAHLLLEPINPHHQHIDFIYYGVAKTDGVRPADGESTQLRWFSRGDLQERQWKMPANVRILAGEAINLLTKTADINSHNNKQAL